jgi:hypothetical protein
MHANQYYVVDEAGRLQTLTEVNPPCESNNTVEVTSDIDSNAKVYRYYTYMIFPNKKDALNEHLKRKKTELHFERANAARANARIEDLLDKMHQLDITIKKLELN